MAPTRKFSSEFSMEVIVRSSRCVDVFEASSMRELMQAWQFYSKDWSDVSLSVAVVVIIS